MRPVLLAVLAALVSGCAATHSVRPADDFAALNARLAGRDAVVVLTDGAAYDASALRVAPDTTTWVDPRTQALLAIATSDIAEIERRDRSRAIRRSVRVGALGGAAVGGTLGAAAGFDSGGCLVFCTGEVTAGDQVQGAFAFGVAGAAVGFVYGAIYGALAGVVVDSAERFVVEVPPGGGAAPAPAAEGR